MECQAFIQLGGGWLHALHRDDAAGNIEAISIWFGMRFFCIEEERHNPRRVQPVRFKRDVFGIGSQKGSIRAMPAQADWYHVGRQSIGEWRNV